MILSEQARLGNKWSQIALALPGRTDGQVKVRWNALWKQSPLAEAVRVRQYLAADGGGESKKPKRHRSLPPPKELLPPVETQRDEVDYMAAYMRSTQSHEATEDTCFCCKDGGDLIECDCNRCELATTPHRTARTAHRCIYATRVS
jgi:hypothetical protein